MLKKEFLPLAIFVLLILWVTGSFGTSFLERDDESDAVADSESEVSSTSTIPAVTATPTRSSSSTPTFTPSPTNTATPTFTPSPTVTPTPSPSNTPVPQPIQNPLAGIVIKNSTLRADAHETGSVVGTAYIGEVFNILNQNGQWIKINIADEKIGWVRKKNVETIEVISSVTPSASPTPDTVSTFLISGEDQYLTERSFIDQLESGQQRWYSFNIADQIEAINITLLVKPITNKVSFAIYTERQYELYEYEDIHSPSVEEIGQVDMGIEKDWINWVGNLPPDSKYFFRIVNNDEQAIEYCLLPTRVESWDKCP